MHQLKTSISQNSVRDNSMERELMPAINPQLEDFAIDKNAIDLKESDANTDKIEEMLVERAEAKKAKNWQKADEIRAHLLDIGVTLEDKIDGTTTWKFENK